MRRARCEAEAAVCGRREPAFPARMAGRSPRPRSRCSEVGECTATGAWLEHPEAAPGREPLCRVPRVPGPPECALLLAVLPGQPATPHTLPPPPTVRCILVHPRWVASGAGSAHQSIHTVTWRELAGAASEPVGSVAFCAEAGLTRSLMTEQICPQPAPGSQRWPKAHLGNQVPRPRPDQPPRPRSSRALCLECSLPGPSNEPAFKAFSSLVLSGPRSLLYNELD